MNDYGLAHLYGISGSIANATVLAFKETGKCANVDKTDNEQGNCVERRYDDLTYDADITIRMRSGYTIPTAGTTLTYESVTYEITEVGRTQVNKGFRTIELKLTRSANITYS